MQILAGLVDSLLRKTVYSGKISKHRWKRIDDRWTGAAKSETRLRPYPKSKFEIFPVGGAMKILKKALESE